MTYQVLTRDQHLNNNGRAKRILSLDGGGLRGVLTVAFLREIEKILRQRHGDSKNFRLCHYFDLIAGTSTGAIIAAALAKGWTVEQVYKKYMALGSNVFEKSFFRKGLLRAKYDEKTLIKELKDVYGANTKLGSTALKTGLLVVAKRLDTGSPWPISNNPRGQYFNSRSGGVIGNQDYPLWQVVRASTAAPTFFESESITIKGKRGSKPVVGEFVDGGVSPFNNPALQAVMYASLDGYRIGWPMGADKLFVVSVGTGTADPNIKQSSLAAKQGLQALASLMDDSAVLQETLLQWMSSSRTARFIDRELGTLQHDNLAGAPLISYLRYNVDLTKDNVQNLDPSLQNKKQIESLSKMDAPENMDILHNLGKIAALRDVHQNDFAANFDLP